MKVRAIRVAEFARFRDAVAVEGLSGGLDLLVGPNEAGKSTLFRALELVLFTNHRTGRADVANVRPHGGGTPLVEADVEFSGELWRVRKRFLTERSAELVSLGRGTVLRGSDAEDALQRLLADAGTTVARQLLWPPQGGLLVNTELDPATQETMRAAAEREVASAAGGEALRRVAAQAKAALSELVTDSRGQPRARYRDAIAAATQAEQALDAAKSAQAEAEHLLERLSELDAKRLEHASPSIHAALTRSLADAEQTVRAARQSVAEREAARVTLANARTAHLAANAAKQAIVELERLDGIERADAEQRAELGQQVERRGAEFAAAEAARSRAHGGLRDAERTASRAALFVRWRELTQRVERARTANERLKAIADEARGLPADEKPIREARTLAARIAGNEAKLAAASVAVTIRYEPGAAARVRIADRELSEGERILAPSTLFVDVPGVGRIEIEPGASSDRDTIEAELQRDRSQFANLLAAGGAESLDMLEERYGLARSLASELEAVRAGFNAIAPQGLPPLERALSEIVATLGEDPVQRDDEQIDPAVAEVAMQSAQTTARDADEAYQTSLRELEILKQKTIALEDRARELKARREALSASLGDGGDWKEKHGELTLTAERTSAALDDALRVERLISATAPDDEKIRKLEMDLEAARRAIEQNERAIAALDRDRAALEGALTAIRREDIAARVAELEMQVETSRGTRDELAEKARALQLLVGELNAEEGQLRERYLAPVMERLAPYLGMVFPEAKLSLGNDYTTEALYRGAHAETIARLSEGTREQIAVLTRLAFARLLADQGMNLPLVLDDPLVFSDDERIGAMLRALERAAQSHQVIVLTCREQSFANLNANRLAITPWNP